MSTTNLESLGAMADRADAINRHVDDLRYAVEAQHGGTHLQWAVGYLQSVKLLLAHVAASISCERSERAAAFEQARAESLADKCLDIMDEANRARLSDEDRAEAEEAAGRA